MNRLDLELKLKEIDPSDFQRMCDYILEKEGNNLVSFGNCEGKRFTKKGTPDSYIIHQEDKTMTFVCYTVQKDGSLLEKIIEDIEKCIKKSKEFKMFRLDKILYYCNSNYIDPLDVDGATVLCEKYSIKFEIYSMFDICGSLVRNSKIVKEIFNEKLDEDFSLTLDDFIDNSRKMKGVDHSLNFYGRELDESKIISSLLSNDITLLTGKAGVGKSMLAVHVLEKSKTEVFCVKSFNENFLDNGQTIFNEEQDIILFLDDVNEISSFNRFVSGLTSKNLEKLKIICTVRDYALNKIETLLSKYSLKYCVIEINPLDDSTIKKIISDNLNIKRELWLDKIATISRGSPRVAIMAAKVILEKGEKALVDSKTVMRNYFDIATDDAIKIMIRNHINLLSFFAFLKNVDIKNLSNYQEIMTLFKITDSDISESVPELLESEIISLYEDTIVQIDDQNLSDYILEKSLIENKCCSICELIIKTVKTKKNNLIECLNIVLFIYSNEVSRKYVCSEISKAWVALENTNDFECFLSVFYIFDTTKSILYVRSKILNGYSLYNDKTISFGKTYDRNIYIDILENIADKHNNFEAFQMLLECLSYEVLRDYAFEALEKCVRMRPEMFTQNGVLNEKVFAIKDFKEKEWFDFVLLSLLDKALNYEFEFTEAKERSFVFSRFMLKDSFPGLKDYRNRLWNLAFLLSDENKYILIESFHNKCPLNDCNDIFANDLKCINNLISSIDKVNILREQLLKISMLDLFRRIGINMKSLEIHDESDIGALIFIIDPKDRRISYEDRKNKHLKQVVEFANAADIEKLKNILNLCKKIMDKFQNYTWKVKDFLKTLIYKLPEEKLDILLDKDFFSSTCGDIKVLLVDAYFKIGKKLECKTILKDINLDPDWIYTSFYLFEGIGKNEIDDDLRDHFYKCLELDLKNERYNRSASAELLYRFSKNDKNFVDLICEINNLKNTNPEKFYSWINLLFNKIVFVPKKLAEIFNENGKINVLEEIVLSCAHSRREVYSLNAYVFSIAKYDIDFIREIVDNLLDYKKDMPDEILSGILEQDNFEELLDIVFDRTIKAKTIFLFPYFIESILLHGHSPKHPEKLIEWCFKKLQVIKIDDEYELLTEIATKIGGDFCLQYYLKIIDMKINIELFKKLLRHPMSTSWTGSEINVVNPKIVRLEKMLSMMPKGLEFMDYKLSIEEYVLYLKDYIRTIRIRDRLNYD